MANWEPYTVADVISKIEQGTIVLPVIQRRLVWDEEKMELLFDTLLKKNSFGGIMALEEERDQKPLFAIRNFTKDGTIVESVFIERIPQNHSLIIDGQQRLQAFYIGIAGSITGKVLYLDLLSDYSEFEFDFRFKDDINRLPTENNEKVSIRRCLWYSVNYLFNRLKLTNDPFQVADEVIIDKKVIDTEEQKAIRMNISYFYQNVFGGKHVGIAKVDINRTLDETSNRQRIVELFRRLNDGGTRLSAYDLVASILKGFEWKMEKFLDDTLKDYQDIGMTQDNLIKLIFILRDNHTKEMSNIEAEDAQFAVDKKDRISETLKALKTFLITSKVYEYYRGENRSFIPLYFIAYHIFHKEVWTENLHKLFDTYDTANPDFKYLFQWIYLSLLNGVFGRGKGWIPYKTGIRKLLNVMKGYKNREFPFVKIIETYKTHPLAFYDKFDENNLNLLDMPFLFYLMYDREAVIRIQDIDHIQPINKLSDKFSSGLINRIENYQLLDVGTNRGKKREKSLEDWIANEVENKELYLSRHLIPEDSKLWKVENYESFLKDRRDQILAKIDSTLNL